VARRTKPVAIPAGGFRAIAVLRLSSLGDIVLTLPVVHALARAYPEARITYWTKEEYQDAVRFDPAIHHVRVLDRDARRIEDLVSMSAELEDADLIVDLHGNTRTKILTFRQRAPILRAASWRLRRGMLVHARAPSEAAADGLGRYAAALAPIGLVTSGVPRLTVDEEAERWATEWLGDGAAGVRRSPSCRVPVTSRSAGRNAIGQPSTNGCAPPGFRYSTRRSKPSACAAELAARAADDPMSRWCVEPLPRIAALLSRTAAAVTSDSGLMHRRRARDSSSRCSAARRPSWLRPGVRACRALPPRAVSAGTLHGRERCRKDTSVA
jgi:hypothetical protein